MHGSGAGPIKGLSLADFRIYVQSCEKRDLVVRGTCMSEKLHKTQESEMLAKTAEFFA